jgi:hypothetical protein
MLLKSKIGAIEFAGDEVRIAVIKSGGGVPAVLEMHVCKALYDEPDQRVDALAAALDTVLNKVKSSPAAYVLCVDAMSCVARSVTIPFRGKRRVAAAVQFELEPYLAFPIEELLLDFKTIGEFDGETEVLAMGIRREDLEEQQAILEAADITVEAVSLDAASLTGLWQTCRKGRSKGLSAVLHVHDNRSSLAITYHKKLVYFRPLDCTEDALINKPRVIAREVQNTIRAFLAAWRGGGEIDTLHITGITLGPAERDTLAEALRLHVEDIMVLDRVRRGATALKKATASVTPRFAAPVAAPVVDTGEEQAEQAPDMENQEPMPESLFGQSDLPEASPSDPDDALPILTPATFDAVIGAAHTAMGGPFAMDFCQSEGNWNGPLRAVVAHLMFAACLGLLVLLGWFFYLHQGTQKFKSLAAGIQLEIDSLNEQIDAIEAGDPGADIDLNLFTDPPLLDILAEISTKMPEGKVAITNIKVAVPGARQSWLTIYGSTESSAAFNEVFEALKESKYLRVEENPDLRLEGSRTNFTIKAFRPTEESDSDASET